MTGRQSWEPTRRGGVRRTRIVQKEDQSKDPNPSSAAKDGETAEALGQSTTQIKWRRAVRIPHRVLVIKFNEKLGLPECPYVVRWRVEFPFGSIRVHHWLSNDDPRAVHDHPWWFLTFVVKGGYTDLSPEGSEILEAPAIRFRKAEHRHTVYPLKPCGAWTVLITGRPLRKWGFYKGGKFVKANKWFLKYGHHPCE